MSAHENGWTFGIKLGGAEAAARVKINVTRTPCPGTGFTCTWALAFSNLDLSYRPCDSSPLTNENHLICFSMWSDLIRSMSCGEGSPYMVMK